jgi:hypothetical protein
MDGNPPCRYLHHGLLGRQSYKLCQPFVAGLQDSAGCSLPPSPGGDDSDIVLEFVDPAPAQLGAAARHALEEIKNKQRDAQRSMADMVGRRGFTWVWQGMVGGNWPAATVHLIACQHVLAHGGFCSALHHAWLLHSAGERCGVTGCNVRAISMVQEHQIRLLKESSKLQRIRRTSGW